jgi:hypothetical protein
MNMNAIKKLIERIKEYFERKRRKKAIKKKIEELRKRDPFIYKH